MPTNTLPFTTSGAPVVVSPKRLDGKYLSGERAMIKARRCQSKRRLVGVRRDCYLARGDLRRESAPLGQGCRASLLVDLPRNEMALLIELVVHLGMN